MKVTNVEINGIVYQDCEIVDITLQQPCPLAGTELESQCKNSYNDPKYRSESCPHTEECSKLVND